MRIIYPLDNNALTSLIDGCIICLNALLLSCFITVAFTPLQSPGFSQQSAFIFANYMQRVVKMAPNSSANGDTHGGAFSLKQEPLDASRPMKVRVIGAGFSGILAAIRSAD